MRVSIWFIWVPPVLPSCSICGLLANIGYTPKNWGGGYPQMDSFCQGKCHLEMDDLEVVLFLGNPHIFAMGFSWEF